NGGTVSAVFSNTTDPTTSRIGLGVRVAAQRRCVLHPAPKRRHRGRFVRSAFGCRRSLPDSRRAE
ncbi:MAG: hypothetical protein AAFU38_16710, partial [Bacteroidota bacterium]